MLERKSVGVLVLGGLLAWGGLLSCSAEGPSAEESGDNLSVAREALAGVGQACAVHGYSNCEAGLFCDHGQYSPAACPPYYTGTCVDPNNCTPLVLGPPGTPPVQQCGCDGVTYVTSCARIQAGIALFKFGPC